ncbi:hypothetical protein NLG97_g7794 [Lecanicillium saksenae]|uniref:Uncharacterized protein n=1 Tax=Lecanicillium saksenae TaxID=468837 RepID=A0ACC1QP12_9HYPO|nr:hypothetical protein NLG97_g7794 [Lecanicillium saksenae]
MRKKKPRIALLIRVQPHRCMTRHRAQPGLTSRLARCGQTSPSPSSQNLPQTDAAPTQNNEPLYPDRPGLTGVPFGHPADTEIGIIVSCYLGCLVVCIGATLQATAFTVAHLVIGRIMTGVGTGLKTSTVPPTVRSPLARPSRLCQSPLCRRRHRTAYWFDFGMPYIVEERKAILQAVAVETAEEKSFHEPDRRHQPGGLRHAESSVLVQSVGMTPQLAQILPAADHDAGQLRARRVHAPISALLSQAPEGDMSTRAHGFASASKVRLEDIDDIFTAGGNLVQVVRERGETAQGGAKRRRGEAGERRKGRGRDGGESRLV